MFRYYIVFLYLTTVYLTSTAATETTSSLTPNTTDPTKEADPSALPVAEKLVRFRRGPPITIVKHVVRATKRFKPKRIKRPKIKHAPINYKFAEPPPPPPPSPPLPAKFHYFKTNSGPVSESFSYRHLPTFHVETLDFNLPPSSYENQVMDVDFYSHRDSYRDDTQPTTVTYRIYEEQTESPSYSHPPRSPHSRYRVPVNHDYSSEYSANDQPDHLHYGSMETADQHYESSADVKPSRPHFSTSEYQENAEFTHNLNNKPYPPSADVVPMPTNKYREPYENPEQSSAELVHYKYSVYDHRKPNYNYQPNTMQQSFAEPPEPSSNVEITYSPSYEINLPPQYISNHHTTPSPAKSPMYDESSQKYHQPHNDYLPSPQKLPLNPNHHLPSYNFPKTSYEVPLYHAMPFETFRNEEHIIYPPQYSDNLSGQPQATSSAELEHGAMDSLEENNSLMNSSDQLEGSEDTHSFTAAPASFSDESQRMRRKNKRKRIRGGTSKHVLDTPDLKKAFEADKRQKQNLYKDLNDIREPKHTEDHYAFKEPYSEGNDHSGSTAWSPLRTHTSSTHIPTPPTSTVGRHANGVSDKGNLFRPRIKFSPTSSTTANPTKTKSSQIQILSINKSRSKSYHDGNFAPTTSTVYQNTTKRLRIRNRPTPQSRPSDSEWRSKGTTKSTLDTTYFKSPQNHHSPHGTRDPQAKDLPRNHKFF